MLHAAIASLLLGAVALVCAWVYVPARAMWRSAETADLYPGAGDAWAEALWLALREEHRERLARDAWSGRQQAQVARWN